MRAFTARTEKLFVVLLALCLCAATAFAQESWQGNAAIARSGEFSTPGLFTASNAFPENTRILVQNPQSGQSVQVTVAQRIPGAGNIFLLLSEEAGTQIGLTGSEVIRVRANVISSLEKGLSESLQEEAYSADPDLNPPISIAEEQLLAGPETPSEEQVQPEAPVEQEEELAASDIAEEVVVEAESQAEAPAAPKEIEKTPEEKRLEKLANRIPQKQLYMPPRQQEIYALAPEPSEAEEIEEEIAAAEEPAEEEEVAPEEEIAEVVVEEAAEEAVIEPEGPQVSMPVPPEEQEDLDVALPGPEAVEPEKPSPEGSRLPVPEEESPLTMEPEEPPFAAEDIEVAAEEEAAVEEVEPLVEEEPVAEIAMAESPPTPEKQMILSEILPSSSYFVQLGAYSTRSLAEKLAGDFTQTYSVTILPASSGGRQFYKVLVGPLNVDESGTLLYQFRSRGFKDAFIQYVE